MNKNIPKLRFPEFENTKGWNEKKLGEICQITNGKSNAQDHEDNGVYPLFDRSVEIKKSNNFLLNCEAVIIAGEGSEFIPKYYKGKFALHQRAYALKDFLCNGKFIFYYMYFMRFVLASKAVGSTVSSLRLPILKLFPINLPQLQEQEKIANCLSSIDDIIKYEKQELQYLRDHKEALMQMLFANK